MNRAKWERKKNKKKHIATNKSGLFIPPFDDGPFVPEKHNKYLRNHKKYLQKIRLKEAERLVCSISFKRQEGGLTVFRQESSDSCVVGDAFSSKKRVSVHPVNLEHRSILYLVANEVNHKSFGVTQLSYNVLEVAYMLMKYNDTSLLSNMSRGIIAKIQKKVRHHIRLSIANRYGYDSLRINIGDVDEEEEDLNSEEIEIECQKKEHLYPKMITGVVGVLSWTIVVAIFIFLLLRAMQLRSGND
ncbi:unnamed protein product [Lepeophtheirus salmonis]|uniref:(salmon louse) hypothetical protein n=1 Tax=Lepeophtheirus salmonis TaxID=72036 RepID=A0A7R8CTF6_LEPSM|nr:unnamed protein product [Lepeophtheirus salmonis]CAF2873369.1 unnamed protein product [Lepeophtheirus salmonis]